jgi:hypothetical protein
LSDITWIFFFSADKDLCPPLAYADMIPDCRFAKTGSQPQQMQKWKEKFMWLLSMSFLWQDEKQMLRCQAHR